MADATRTRILDACVAILARDVSELSIPAVAREAGVSVPTVYRNFSDKRTLVRETERHLRKIRGQDERPTLPDHLDDLPRVVREQFARGAATPEVVFAAIASTPITKLRLDMGMRAKRQARVSELLRPHLRDYTPRERAHAVAMTTVLCSSATLRAFLALTDLGAEDAAEAVCWTLDRILAPKRPQ